MTTPIVPALGRLDSDLVAAEQALSRAMETAELAGARATAFTRVSIRVYTPEEVDTLAAAWGVTASYGVGDRQYFAATRGGSTELEVIWYRPSAPKDEAAV